MLCASETWPMTIEVLTRLRRNDNAMIRWVCSKRLFDNTNNDNTTGSVTTGHA